MTEFLRDLSPQRSHDATRVVALLPSQFEAVRPLRSHRSDASLATEAQELSSPWPSPSPAGVMQPSDLIASRNYFLNAATPVVIAARSEPPASLEHGAAPASRPAESPRAARSPRVATPIAEPAATSQTARESGATEDVRPIGREAQSEARQAPASPRVEVVPVSRTRQISPHPAASAIAAMPISARTLAARPAPPTESRPVVHVTIDRIEVRAPATPDPPTPPARSRATSPRVSLSDYLGAREPHRNGDMS